MVSGDVSVNPGPGSSGSSVSECENSHADSTYYPCGVCQRHVTWEDKAVCCEECYVWYHIGCHHIQTDTYEGLKSSSAAWTCEKCGEINYSQHAFQSSIRGLGDLSANKFQPLSASFNNSSFTDLGFPLYTSTPDKVRTAQKKFVPKKKRSLRVVTLNCQSLKNKPELLQNLADSTKPDVIIGTESWLIPEHKVNGILNSEIFPDGYKISVARRDRQDVPMYSETPDVRGGGTFILVKDDIMAVRQYDLETDCEIVWTKFDIVGSRSVYVASYYRPKENDKNSLVELKKSLERICNRNNSHVWVGGDFNFPGYNWQDELLKPCCSQPELTRNFIDLIADNGLTQVVKEPTFFENTLDLFLVNNQ